MSFIPTSGDSSDSPLFTSNLSVNNFFSACLGSPKNKIIYTTYALTNVILLPLYFFILLVGFQRWRRQRSTTAGATMSHSDFFTYQMMIVGIVEVFGSVFLSLGKILKSETSLLLGVFLLGFVVPGQTSFHVLTCVERYLVVVHAMSYINLKERIKVRVRNISTGTVWLVCLGWSGLIKVYLPDFPTDVLISFLVIYLIITSFCCLSVLHFLRRPRPGDAGGNQQRSDQSKRRAFNMISAITVTLALRICGILLFLGVKNLLSVDIKALCVLMDLGIWLTMPSNLVLPLLFLHRAGKLVFIRKMQDENKAGLGWLAWTHDRRTCRASRSRPQTVEHLSKCGQPEDRVRRFS